MRVLNLFLLIITLMLLLVYLIPEPETCFIPPNAPTRGIYAECWTDWELWG